MATRTHVNTDSVQTLSNKTLTAPLINGGTCGADPTAALGIATKQFVESILASALPAGIQLPYAGASPPVGWLACDGAAVSRTTYAALFSVCSTTYGAGNGSTTFNLPDKRGRGSIGSGLGTSLTNRVRGTKLGEEAHALTLAENGPHTHNYTTRSSTGVFGSPGANGWDGLNTNGSTTTSSGSGTPHNNMQPSEVDLWIIKT